MTTQQFKIILAQNPQIQLFILLAFIEYAELENLESSKKSLSQEFKDIVKNHKFTSVAGQLTEFGIVNLISWLDPVSGFGIGIVCLFGIFSRILGKKTKKTAIVTPNRFAASECESSVGSSQQILGRSRAGTLRTAPTNVKSAVLASERSHGRSLIRPHKTRNPPQQGEGRVKRQ